MSTRRTALNVVAATIGGTDWSDRIKSLEISPEVIAADGRTILDRYQNEVVTAKDLRFSSRMLRGAKTARLTALDVSAWTTTEALIGSLESGRVLITTDQTDEGKAVNSQWRFPNPIGTAIEITGKFKPPSAVSPAAFALMFGALSGLDVACTITINAQTITADMLMKAVPVSIEAGRISRYDVSLSGKIDGSAPVVAGQALLVDIATGDAAVAYSLDVGFGKWEGNAIITRGELVVENEALIEESFDFANQGTPTFTAGV